MIAAGETEGILNELVNLGLGKVVDLLNWATRGLGRTRLESLVCVSVALLDGCKFSVDKHKREQATFT